MNLIKQILKMGQIEITIDDIFEKWNNGKYNLIFDYNDFIEALKKSGYKII